MGFEPTTLRDLVFSEFSKHLIYHVFVVSSLMNPKLTSFYFVAKTDEFRK